MKANVLTEHKLVHVDYGVILDRIFKTLQNSIEPSWPTFVSYDITAKKECIVAVSEPKQWHSPEARNAARSD